MHEGHRTRVKQKFLYDGIDGFEPHEILELLLYYAIPRRDTNEIAHKLIDTFGSLSAVFDAPVDTLMKVEGIGESAALLMKMVPELSRRYMDDKHSKNIKIIDIETAGTLLLNKFIGRNNETVILMLMDIKGKLLFCGTINEGNFNTSDVYIRKIIELAMRYNACSAILSHNHPSGFALPSNDDLLTTQIVRDALALVNVKLLDHIIVADDDYVSIALSPIGENIFKTSNVNKKSKKK